MELLVKRISSGVEATLGVMHDTSGLAAKFLNYTLEDQHNEPKIPGETRIPAGRYQVILRTEDSPMNARYGNRFPWHRGMLWLQNVPDFTYVYIHVGNKDDDTEGCILVGDGQISNVEERGQVTTSVAAYKRLYAKLVDALSDGDEVWITVEDWA